MSRGIVRSMLAAWVLLASWALGAAGATAPSDARDRLPAEIEEQDARLTPRSAHEPAAMIEAVGSPSSPDAVCATTVLSTDGSTSGNPRAPSTRFRGIRAVYLITAAELASSGLPSGSSPSGIGWHYATAPGIAGTGTLTVYLQNTTDTTNTKSASFATAITGMTTVHNASTTLPNTTTPFDIAFSGGSPFTYTGGGLYVAYDWRYPTGTLSTTAVSACNVALVSGLEFSSTTVTPPAPDGLSASNFRPETRLTVTIDHDVSVDYVVTMGQLPGSLAGTQVVEAVITNKGNAQTDVPVTLNITGAQTFTDTQTIAALGACGGQTTVSFAPFAPSVLGDDTVTVSVPADDVAGNNSRSRPLQNTVNRYSYKYPGTIATGGVGVTGAVAEFQARFHVASATQVDAVTVEFPTSIPTAVYRVSIRADGGGTPGSQLYEDASDRTVTAGSQTIRLPAPVAIGPGDFFVGVEQTSTINMGLSFDAEVPVRSGVFYLSIGGSAFADFFPGNNFKLNIGAIVGNCLVPLTSSVTPDTASICAGNPITFTSALTGGTGAPTGQWTESGSDIVGQTGPTLVVTKGTAGAFAYNAKATDDGGCIDIVDPVFSVGTWLGDGAACDDGNACTNPDVCTGATCSGPNPCDDGSACTNDICDGQGGCSYTTVNCDDANPCTDDSCSPGSGCGHTSNTATCTDGNPCTIGDACVGGACVPGTGSLPPAVQVCNTDLITIPPSGTATPYPSVVTVSGQVLYLCNVSVSLNALAHQAPSDIDMLLSRASGANAIVMSDVGGNIPVSGVNLLLKDDAGGTLPGGGPLVSGAYKPTNLGTGDVFPPPAPTPGGGSALSVFAGANPNGAWDLWIVDQFSPFSGSVADGWCVNLVAVCTTAAECDDGNGCTDDACVGATCVHTPNTATCTDGNECTANDVCSGGACVPGGNPCNDGNACTNDLCGAGASCSYTTVTCDDSNVCTNDSCDLQAGCVFDPNTIPCNDGSACTSGDVCGAGTCHPGTATVCDDNNPCTDDSCNPSTGACVFTNNTASCSDGDACTSGDVCSGGGCLSGGPTVCNDNNLCTDDSCSSQTGCVFAPNTSSCDDGSLCTTGDVCVGGSCQPGVATVCDDSSPCTDDLCVPATGGCVFTNNTAVCDDNNACTSGEVCSNGTCGSGTSVVCDDGNPCTDDFCDAEFGCWTWPNTAPCQDGDACTTGDVCVEGVCQAGGPIACNDDNLCTTDSCAPATGCVFTPGAVTCNDANPCTDDACVPADGSCTFTNNTAPCEDGNVCTAGDTCGGGSCQSGSLPAIPPEAAGMRATDKTTYTWTATLHSTQYDAVRGLIGALPVGPGGGDELCFDDLGAPALVDAATPDPGSGFWYLVRGENVCYIGSYGTQSNGTPRETTTCP